MDQEALGGDTDPCLIPTDLDTCPSSSSTENLTNTVAMTAVTAEGALVAGRALGWT